ncbi:MAG: hypothetical protein RID91_06800 [Azospirillaceae bacterium]
MDDHALTIEPIAIHGRGPAGLTAARLLARSGIEARLIGGAPAGGPVLLLNPGTCRLLCELWDLRVADLPARHRLAYRAVHPPAPEPPALVEQHGLVVDGAALAAFLDDRLAAMHPGVAREDEPDAAPVGWRLLASGRALGDGAAAAEARVERIGRAVCAAVEVAPGEGFRDDRAVFEAVPGGWLFLLPLGPERALLQAQREAPAPGEDPVAADLAHSRAVAAVIGDMAGAPARVFEAMPRLARPTAGPGWLAIGDAAMGLPPVTGDGVGNGLRTAILAAAVLRALRRGEPTEAVLAHYDSRLVQAFDAVTRRTGHSDAPPPGDAARPTYTLRGLDLVRS